MEVGQFRVDLVDGGVQVGHDVGSLSSRCSGCKELSPPLGDLDHDEDDDEQGHDTEGEPVHDHVYVHVVVDRGGGGWFLRGWDGQVRGLLLAHEGGAGCWTALPGLVAGESARVADST